MEVYVGQRADEGAADRRAAVIRAVATMRAGLAHPHPLTALARSGMFSPYHFHRLFRDITGITPARFLSAIRMAEARRLLLYTDLPVRRIAERIGYRSPGTFGTRFARAAGLTPARFRAFVQRLSDALSDGPLAARLARVGDSTEATLSLSGLPPSGSLVLGRFDPGGGDRDRWAIWTLPGTVRLPSAPDPGGYSLLAVAVLRGVRLADVLVDRPGSYLLGRARIVPGGAGRTGAETRVALHWPGPTDPPRMALTPIDGLVSVVV